MSRRARHALAALLVLASTGCAPKRVAAPLPESEDYVFPAPTAGELSRDEDSTLRRAWQDIVSGDPAAASRRLQRLRLRGSRRPSVETAIGYAQLRAARPDDALASFEGALSRAPGFAAALVGAGSAAARRGDADAALDFYRRARAAAPGDTAVRKRIAALKLQVGERHLSRAEAAASAGDAATAAREYSAVLAAAPELSAVRLSLAELLQRQGDVAAAVNVLEADPTRDRQVSLRLAGALAQQGSLERAAQVYRELLARDPSDGEARAGLAAARDALDSAGLPEDYRRIPEAARVTRADLAALLVVRVKALRGAAAAEPPVAVDIGGCWARPQITSALALNLMDVYSNHTFQPTAVVRRLDVARAAARILDRLGWPRTPAPAPTDIPRSHLDYAAVERVLGSGLMGLTESGAFEPWRPVSGREAIDVVDAVARLVGG